MLCCDSYFNLKTKKMTKAFSAERFHSLFGVKYYFSLKYSIIKLTQLKRMKHFLA